MLNFKFRLLSFDASVEFDRSIRRFEKTTCKRISFAPLSPDSDPRPYRLTGMGFEKHRQLPAFFRDPSLASDLRICANHWHSVCLNSQVNCVKGVKMKKSPRKLRRRPPSSFATLLRAVVLEGTGIIVLVFLLTMSQSTAADSTERSKRPLLEKIRTWVTPNHSLDLRQDEFEVPPIQEPQNQPLPKNPSQEFRQFRVERYPVKQAIGYGEGD